MIEEMRFLHECNIEEMHNSPCNQSEEMHSDRSVLSEGRKRGAGLLCPAPRFGSLQMPDFIVVLLNCPVR